MKIEPLSRIEWDFDNVPDDELIVCRLCEHTTCGPGI
jgi:hypothetical protein